MGNLLKSSATARIARCRHDLVLDLATRYGPFWEAVSALRQRWGIKVIEEIPPQVPTGLIPAHAWEQPNYVPQRWPSRLPPSPLARFPGDGDDIVDIALLGDDTEDDPDYGTRRVVQWRLLFGETEPPPTGPPEILWRAEWWADLERLHDRAVPAPCRRAGPTRADSWLSFLAACVVYDPPRDDLLTFADALPMGIDLPPRLIQHVRDGRPIPDDLPAMVYAPIVPMRDAETVEQVTVRYYEELLAALGRALAGKGIDLTRLRTEIVARDPAFADRRQRLRDIPYRHYIDVREETTKTDVAGAFDLLKATMPPRSQANRPERDALTCVQCATWHDQFGWSNPQIVHRLKLLGVVSVTGRRYSESARTYVEAGRAILAQRKAPP